MASKGGFATSPAEGAARSGTRRGAKLTFSSSFEEGVALLAPPDGGSWQHLSGTDSATGFA
jgi:hypothetical protein